MSKKIRKRDVANHPKNINYDNENAYIKDFMSYYNNTDESIIRALSVLNAQTLGQETASGENFEIKYGEDIIEFFDFFMQNFYTEEFEEKMWENWGDLPRIIRIALCLMEQKQHDFYEKASSSLTGKKKKNAETLAKYFLSDTERERVITVTNNIGSFSETLYPEKDKENPERNRTIAYGLSAVFFAYKGRCVFRTIVKDDYQIVNGFRIENGKPERISAQELKYCMQRQPDGSMAEFPEDRYQEAFVKFD